MLGVCLSFGQWVSCTPLRLQPVQEGDKDESMMHEHSQVTSHSPLLFTTWIWGYIGPTGRARLHQLPVKSASWQVEGRATRWAHDSKVCSKITAQNPTVWGMWSHTLKSALLCSGRLELLKINAKPNVLINKPRWKEMSHLGPEL